MSLWTLGSTAALRGPLMTSAELDVPPTSQPAKPAMAALNALAKYIPAETTTAFLASLGLLAAIDGPSSGGVPLAWVVYATCAVLTPVFVYLSARVTWQSAASKPATFATPVWRMSAAALAFLVWALAVPGMLPDKGTVLFASVGAILVSPLFVLIEEAFGLDR